MSFFSLILLCCIFWILGTKQQQVPDEEEVAGSDQENAPNETEGIAEVKVEDFNADDEFQLKVWQYLVRGRKDTTTDASSNIGQNLSTMIQEFEEYD